MKFMKLNLETKESGLTISLESNGSHPRNKKVYILIYRLNHFLDKAIELVTKDYYNHTAISLDPHFERCFTFSLDNNSLVNEHPTARPIGSEFIIHELAVTEHQFEAIKDKILEMSSKKYKYNFKELAGIVLNIEKLKKKEDTAFYCTQFVYHLLKESGVTLVDSDSEIYSAERFSSYIKVKKIMKELGRYKVIANNKPKYLGLAKI